MDTLEQPAPKKRGPKPKPTNKKKVGMTLTLLPSKKAAIEAMAEEKGVTPADLILTKFNLK